VPPATKPGILIVDDFDDTRELLAEYFMHAGYHSIMAKNGLEALERLREIRPDLIVTDLEMPGMNGAELLRSVRADPRIASVPVILVTGSGRAAVLAQLGDDAQHFRAILVKPIKLSELHSAVETALATP
jgi:CheY-like chemotaxis protein